MKSPRPVSCCSARQRCGRLATAQLTPGLRGSLPLACDSVDRWSDHATMLHKVGLWRAALWLVGAREMLGLSRVRFAAGVCLLAAGLLMGGAGGAVAVADPDSSSSAADGDDGTNASGQHSTTASSPGKRETSTLGSGPQTFHRRENPEERAWRHGHQGRAESHQGRHQGRAESRQGRAERLGPRRRGSRSSRAGPQCGRAGNPCGRAGSQCGRASL